MEGEFCKIYMYKICVSNHYFTFMKQKRINSPLPLWKVVSQYSGCHHTILDVFRMLTFISGKLTKSSFIPLESMWITCSCIPYLYFPYFLMSMRNVLGGMHCDSQHYQIVFHNLIGSSLRYFHTNCDCKCNLQ